MYLSRRRYRHHSNTPMYYSRNPVKTLHPYTGTSNFAIETKDLPKAATYLKENSYKVFSPKEPISMQLTSIAYKYLHGPTELVDITWQRYRGTNITIPANHILLYAIVFFVTS